MKIELVYFAIFWMNAFPAKAGVSRKYSPRELVLRMKADYAKHCRVLFGSIVKSTMSRPLPTP